MLKELVRFEWRYHTRQLSFAGATALFLVLGFALTATGFGPASVNINSPYSIMQSVGVLSLLSLFILALFCSSAMVRDREFRMEEIVFATAVEKLELLTGRFAGSFLAALSAFSASLAGMILASFLPTHDPARIGSLQPGHYLWAFVVMSLPNLLFAAVVLFAIASVTRSLLASSLGAIVIYVLYFAAAAWTNSPLMAASAPGAREGFSLAALLDPFGLSAFFNATRYWTPGERNSRLVPLSGLFLANRLIWISVAAAGWLITFRQFSFRLLRKGGTKQREKKIEEKVVAAPYAPVAARCVPWRNALDAYCSATAIGIRSYLGTATFLVLTMLWFALALSEIASSIGSGEYGSTLYPTSGLLSAALSQLLHRFSLIVLIYYSTDTVWRERTLRFDGILHSTPVSSAVFVLSKMTVLALLVFAFILTGALAGICYGLANGYTLIEPSVIAAFGWFTGAPLVLFATAAVVIHTFAPNRFVGMLSLIFLAVVVEAGSLAGLHHHLWRFASAPSVARSDLSGFSPFATSFNWYMLHWSLAGALFLTLATLRWRRAGIGRGFAFKGTAARFLVGILVVACGLSALHIAWRTIVQDRYETPGETIRWKAGYERKYAQFARWPQPRITSIVAKADLYPEERRYRVRGHYLMKNGSGKPLRRFLVSVRRDARDVSLSTAGGRVSESDPRFGHYWIDLTSPLASGAFTRLDFDLGFANPGFSDSDPDTSILPNGSFFRGFRFPLLGYRKSYELTDPADRRKQRLLVDSKQRDSDSLEAEEESVVEWVTTDVTISTPADQHAVTSGQLVRQWRENGRRLFRFRSEREIPNVLSFAAGRYQVARSRYRNVALAVHYHPDHHYNVERMVGAARDTLEYLEASFGAYPYSQLKIVEVPSTAAQGGLARPDTIFIAENSGFLLDARDPHRLDLTYRRTAHEVAHQWWGLLLSPASSPGATVLTESTTKYCELKLLERKYGREIVRQSLTYELDRYLSGRARDSRAELPLSKAGNESYLYYRKGAVVLYAIGELLGERRMNEALRALMVEQSGRDRQPSTRHLLSHLQSGATAAERELIDQWMTRTVLYDLRLESARSRAIAGGRFEVTLRITAEKSEQGSNGSSQRLPFDEEIELGLFAGHPDQPGLKDNGLHLAKHRLQEGANAITIVVSRPPLFAVVDPSLLRIDRNRSDNMGKVE